MRSAIFAATVLVFLSACQVTHAAQAKRGKAKPETPQEIEAREAAAEEDAYQKMGEADQGKQDVLYVGKLIAAAIEDNPDVVAMMTIAGSRTVVPVKVSDQALKTQIARFDKQNVLVNGRLRNNGKYLVADSISLSVKPEPGPVQRKRGGL